MALEITGGTAAALIPFARRFPSPGAIWTPQWIAARQRLLAEALTNPDILATLADAHPLPDGFGVAMDERLVEWPWVLAQRPSGRMLDAGSTLNHTEVLDHFLPRIDDLHILTLEPEAHAYTQRRISYVYADLRELPYRDDWFDTIASISVLEHVGMDNTRYGDSGAALAKPDLDRALLELKRVLKPEGQLLITVPYGYPDNFGWFRVFDQGMVERMIETLAPGRVRVVVYRYDAGGWRVSDYADAADVRYRDHEREPAPVDLAPNARAVACLRVVK